MLGDDVGTVLLPTDYHEASRGLGGEGLLLDDPAQATEILRQAFRDRAPRGAPSS